MKFRLVGNRLDTLHSSPCTLHLKWSATRDLHPEGSAILSRRGLPFPLKPVAEKLVPPEELCTLNALAQTIDGLAGTLLTHTEE